MRLFLIDDEIVALNALKKRVDWLKYGFTEVYTAQETKSVWEFLKKDTVDLILCDVEMPGENGLEFLKEVKIKYPKTECIMVTCHADFNYIQKAMRYGAEDYILKPIDYEELEEILNKYIAKLEMNQMQTRREELIEQVAHHRSDDSESRIPLVMEYIDEHLRDKITIRELADLVHINEQHLMRIFRKETGRSVVEYITDRRMLTASDLLRNTDLSVNFIADCVGCENYSYFTKIFKKHTGLPPREYRMKFKKS